MSSNQKQIFEIVSLGSAVKLTLGGGNSGSEKKGKKRMK